MTPVQTLFLLLRCELFGAETGNRSFTEEELLKVYRLAKKHDLEHLVADQIISRKLISETSENFKKIQKSLMVSLYRFEQLSFIENEIFTLFEQNGIDFMPLKGTVIRKLYPKPFMRTSCDTDILIKESDIDCATDLLKNQTGAKVGTLGEHDIPFTFNNGMHAELHFKIINKSAKGAVALQNVWENSVLKENTKHTYILNDEYFYLHHIAHMAKHTKNGGCGIRPFLDLWFLNQNTENTEKRNELIKKCGLDAFLKAANELSAVWCTGKDLPEHLRYFQKYTVLSGAYGTNETAAVSNKKTIDLKKTKGVFLPPDKLKYIYPTLQNRPSLYPVFSLRRVWHLAFSSAPKMVLSNRKSKKAIKGETEHIEDLMNELNLD